MSLLAFLALCFGAAGLGQVFASAGLRTWYRQLRKPEWTPPDRVFGPVWSALYAAMAVAAWLVWRRGAWRETRGALALFGVQLLLNVGWSAVFFGLRQPGAAFVELLALWSSILATAIAFGRTSPISVVLMAPYLAWVTFAATLNFAIWRLNRRTDDGRGPAAGETQRRAHEGVRA